MILSKLKHNMKSDQNERITMNLNNTLTQYKLWFHSNLGVSNKNGSRIFQSNAV